MEGSVFTQFTSSHPQAFSKNQKRQMVFAESRRPASASSAHSSSRKVKGPAPHFASAGSRQVEVGEVHRDPIAPLQAAGGLEYQDAAGWLSFHLGYYEAAASYLSEAIQKNPRDGRAYDQRAEVYQRTGKPTLAITDYEHALMIDPKDGIAMQRLAWLMASSHAGRDHKRAITLAQEACNLTQWKDAKAVETLAAAYASAGAFEKAIAIQGQALALQHDASQAAARLALYAQHRTIEGKPAL
ncbi:MAG TPA: tetratricopeptide repeat protein [Candidatus Binataceae bacterium]|nr:tetratricopeptide repeat protein [Candidatus Binataceae bacterium]